MKASRYNRIFRASDGTWLAFNAWSTALAEIEPEDLPFIESLLDDPDGVPCDTAEKKSIREAMVHAHFLVDDGEDELASLKTDMLRDRFRTNQLNLTIAPTLDCNFRCDYCYEEHLRVTMSRPVQQALLGWVAERVPALEEVHVTWFGGEPTLPRAWDVVESVSRKLQALADRHGIEYDAQLVTNGYLLTRERMETAAKLGIRDVQITLDGPPETHDRRRVLAGGQGTFFKILENLERSIDLARFQIRINVDRRNAASTLDVVEILAERGLADEVRLHLAQVTFDGAACGNIQESCYSSREFARTEIELYREAAKRGLPLSRYPFRIEGAFCTADRVNGYVVGPSGSIFKCWHEVTMQPDRAVGSLLDGEQPYHRANETRWLAWDPLEKSGCRSCDVLPLCHGGCPLEARATSELDRGACESYRYELEPLLEIRHLHRLPMAEAPVTRGGTRGSAL